MAEPPDETPGQRADRLHRAALAPDDEPDGDSDGPPPAQAAGFSALLAGIERDRSAAEARWAEQQQPRPGRARRRPPTLAPAVPAPVPTPPAEPAPPTTDERLAVLERTVDRLIGTANARADQLAGFQILTKLQGLLQALDTRVADARNALVLRIKTERELSLARLAQRLEISPARAEQLVRAANGQKRRTPGRPPRRTTPPGTTPVGETPPPHSEEDSRSA